MKWLLTLAVASMMVTATTEAQGKTATFPTTDTQGREVATNLSMGISISNASQEERKFNWNEAIDNQEADKPATYKGGATKLFNDLSKNLVYPTSALNAELQGVVMVVFGIDEKGQVAAIKIIKSLSPDCDRAAANAVMKFKRFKPAMHHGKAIPVKFTLPIKFGMQ